MKAVTVSTKKKCRRGDKSQDQTTSKKTTSAVAHMTKETKDSTNNVVTPARTSMPRNKLTSIVKSSQEKTSQANVTKKPYQQPTSQINKSTAKKDLTSSNKDERLKSTEERAESQPPKKMNALTKQDSSKYLRGGSSHLPTQYSQQSSHVLSNQKSTYGAIPSGAKLSGNTIDA
jgi:hypothetical protein